MKKITVTYYCRDNHVIYVEGESSYDIVFELETLLKAAPFSAPPADAPTAEMKPTNKDDDEMPF